MTDRQDWIDGARAVRIEAEIGRRGIRLVGKRKSRCGPCPKCGGDDRFSINTVRGVFNCRGCKAAGDVIALVQFLDDCTFSEACETLTGKGRPVERRGVSVVRPAPPPLPVTSDTDNTRELARGLWREAVPIEGTLAERYLSGRGLVVPEGVSGRVLRFHPSCPFGPGVRHPCMVALFREIAGDMPVAIHRTALTADGRKIDRKALGAMSGAAIKVTADADVTYGLHIAEGVETTLAGVMLGLQPAWALGTAGAIGGFPVLSGIDALTILVDRDPAGMDAAASCSERWTAAGCEVSCVISPVDTANDINDLMRVS